MDTIRQRLVVCVLLYNPHGEVLLQKRDDRPDLVYRGAWTLFGGSAEDGETPEQAIRRELEEELELTDAPLTFWMQYECPVRTIRGEVTTTNAVFFAPLTVPFEQLVLHEGERMAFYSAHSSRDLQLAFEQNFVLQQFFELGLAYGHHDTRTTRD
jgi:8-oxo-dGTP diphosphatase